MTPRTEVVGVMGARFHDSDTSIVVIVPHPNMSRVVMIMKEGDDLWRYPSTFFDTSIDENFEDAAIRAMKESVPTIEIQRPQILRSKKIEDAITLIVKAPYSKGSPTPGVSIKAARWFAYTEVSPKILIPAHHGIAETMLKCWYY